MPNHFGDVLIPPQSERNIMRKRALDFLKGKTADHTGVKVDQYFYMNDADMESCHGWVQWAFPIDTISLYNDKCGNIYRDDRSVLNAFRYDTPLWHMRMRLVELYLKTIGIDLYARTHYTKFFQVVDSPYNHHMKRISRVLTHLMITGQVFDAKHLYKTLINDLVMRDPTRFTPATIAYWSSIVLEFDETTRELL